MAVRVRKLAKELDQSPWHVLGLLQAIGFERYRSPDDMLPDVTVDKLRRAIKDGVKALPVAPVEEPSPPPRVAQGAAPGDLMAKLVPGVVRPGAPPPASTRPAVRRATHPPPEAKAADAAARRLDADRQALDTDVRSAQAEREAVAADRRAVEAERQALVALRAALAE